MATTTPTSFWPDLGDPIRTPLTILKEQAAELGRSTQHLLEAEVRTLPEEDRLVHRLTIFAPSLDYRFRLLTFTHDVHLYPATGNAAADPPAFLKDEKEFSDWLRRVLSSDDTKRILVSLISQIKA